MLKTKKVIICILVCLSTVFLFACEKKSEADISIYKETISNLTEDQFVAVIEMETEYPVLLVSSNTYEYDKKGLAALACDVYYMVNGTIEKIGTVESLWVDFPICYDDEWLFGRTFSEIHGFKINEETGALEQVERVYEETDKEGNPVFIRLLGEEKEVITKEEYSGIDKRYNKAEVVLFQKVEQLND